MLKKIIKKLFKQLGYEIKPIKTNIGWNAAYLSTLGNPSTVVDVGVGCGSPELYAAFPEARFILIEPLFEYEKRLKEITTKYNAQYFLCALGSQKKRITIHVDTSDILKSSFYERTRLTVTGNALRKREVDVITLDELMATHEFKPPFALKVDTEGFELEVVTGSSEFLKYTEFVIAEVSVAKRFEGSYEFSEFINEMKENGFYLFDILWIQRKESAPGILYLDAVFRNVDCHKIGKKKG